MGFFKYRVTLVYIEVKAWIRIKLMKAAMRLGMPNPYYDGIAASLECDSIDHYLDTIQAPRDIEGYPLTTAQRVKLVTDNLVFVGFWRWETQKK